MLTTYTNWKKINESNNILGFLTFDFNVDNQLSSEFPRRNLGPDIDVVIEYFTKHIPTSYWAEPFLIIPNTIYENVDGKKEDLKLELNKYLGNSRLNSEFYSNLLKIGYPSFIINTVLPNFKDQIINKSPQTYEISLLPEFISLSEEELRDKILNKTQAEIIKQLGSDPRSIDLQAEAELLMMITALGGLVDSSNDEMALIFHALNAKLLDVYSEILNLIPINKEVINIDTLKLELEEKIKPFIIDYSKLTDSQILKIKPNLINLIEYLVKILRRRGSQLNRIAVDTAVMLLNHIEKYPNAYEIFYPDPPK